MMGDMMHVKQEEYTFEYVKEKLITIFLLEELKREFKKFNFTLYDSIFNLGF